MVHVSDTAFLVAQHRALESARPDALFRDPFASRLAGSRDAMISAGGGRRALAIWSVAIRTVIIDDYLRAAIAGGVDTVLNLGAGLDARPYRMALPRTLRWIEVDYPVVIDLKEARLAGETPRCRLDRARVDLLDVPARRELFAQIDRGSSRLLVLTEGVIPYLGVGDVGLLAHDLHDLRAAGGWIVDYISPRSIRLRNELARRRAGAFTFEFEPLDWFGFFEQHGWKPREKRFLAKEGARLGRPPPLPRLARGGARLVRPSPSAQPRRSFRDFAGYFLLEPVRS